MPAWTRFLIACGFIALGPAVAPAQPGAPEAVSPAGMLAIGDQAPELHVTRWVKGDPIAEFAQGRVYAVEFWATWCGPCVAGIPHLTELQNRFREQADFIGVTRADESNTLEVVSEFVASQGEAMDYRVAFDSTSRTWSEYMEAAGRGGIPCAFLVDKQGRIAWVGHPAEEGFERTLGLLVADKFDLEAARRADAERVAGAERVARTQRELHEAWAAGDRPRALALADEIVASNPEGMSQWAWWKFETLLSDAESAPSAYAYVRELRDGPYKDDAEMLLRFAFGIADSLGIESPDLDLALGLAERAVELTGEQDSRMLAGLAMVHMRRKEFDKGIAAQQRAIDLAPSPAMKQHLGNELEFFRLEKEFAQDR